MIVDFKQISILCGDGFGSKILDPGLGQPSLVWGWVWKISPINPKFFNFFPLRIKKISLGRVKKYLGQRQVGLLFTAGQKYARVRLGPISSFVRRSCLILYLRFLIMAVWILSCLS